MASTDSSASTAHPSTPKDVRERVLRAVKLHREDPEGVEPLGHGTYKVGPYTVDLDVFADDPEETCSCPDYRRRHEPCKHIYLATIARAKHLAASSRRRGPRRSAAAVAASLAKMEA